MLEPVIVRGGNVLGLNPVTGGEQADSLSRFALLGSADIYIDICIYIVFYIYVCIYVVGRTA